MFIKCTHNRKGLQDHKRKFDHKYPRKLYSMIVNMIWKEMDKDFCLLTIKTNKIHMPRGFFETILLVFGVGRMDCTISLLQEMRGR